MPINGALLIGNEKKLPGVATLRDVMRNVSDYDICQTSYPSQNTRKRPVCPQFLPHGEMKAVALSAEYDFGDMALNSFFQSAVPDALVLYVDHRVRVNPELKPAIDFVFASEYEKEL
jgi:hypothetical protein